MAERIPISAKLRAEAPVLLDADAAPGDRFSPAYNPLTEPPLPRPEPARPSLIRRAVGFAAARTDFALAYTLSTVAVLALLWGRS